MPSIIQSRLLKVAVVRTRGGVDVARCHVETVPPLHCWTSLSHAVHDRQPFFSPLHIGRPVHTLMPRPIILRCCFDTLACVLNVEVVAEGVGRVEPSASAGSS